MATLKPKPIPPKPHERATVSTVVKAAAIKRLRRKGLRNEGRAARTANSKTSFGITKAESFGPGHEPMSGVHGGPRQANRGTNVGGFRR